VNLQQKFYSPWSTRRIILASLSAAAVIVGFWMIYRYRLVLLIFFSAIVLATALKPINSWFVGRGLSNGASVVSVCLLLTLLLATILWLIIPIVIEQSLTLAVSGQQIYQDLRTAIIKSPIMFLSNLALYIPVDIRMMISDGTVETESMDKVPGLITFSITFLKIFLAGLTVFLLTFFWILEGDRAIRVLLLYIPLRYRQDVQTLFEDVEVKLGAYVRGQITLCLVISVSSLVYRIHWCWHSLLVCLKLFRFLDQH
jgi:predicted PurR-regulated permease PerM